MKRVREWLAETHGDTFELVRHFLARFFDSELVASTGDWQKVAIGVFSVLVSIPIIGFDLFLGRYNHLQNPGLSTRALYHAGLREDLLSFLVLGMALTALLTLIQWDSLFPTLRDCLALAGFPVSARQIFTAKFSALVLMFTAFGCALNMPLGAAFGVVISGPWQENSALTLKLASVAAPLAACASVFFTLLALQGLLLNVVPGRFFLRVSLLVQGVLFIGVVGAIPLIGRQPQDAAWYPPVWFLHLWESIVTGRASAAPALLALWVPPVLAVAFYLISYHRYHRLLLEAPPARAAGRFTALAARLLELWIRDPREQAAFSFIWKTLARSRSHRLILLAYCGLALGWMVKSGLDAPPVSLHNEGMYGLAAVLVPLGLAALTILALRYLFTLPVALRANWMFQTLDAEGRAAWLAAVQRFAITCGIAPFFLLSFPATLAIFGPLRALAVTAMDATVALIFFERIFRNWRKLPFTCSYMPGKQPVWLLLLRWSFGLIYLAAVPPLLLSASGDPAAFLALFTLLLGWCWRWRTNRLREWADATLLYEEALDPDLFALGLRPLEDDARVTSTQQQRPAEMFSTGMVASKGFLPEAWEEEFDEDRRHPAALFRSVLEDVRYGCRLIRRNPLLSLTVVLTLTVGIGINASIFTVVNGMMLRPHVSGNPDTFLRIVPQSRLQSTNRQLSYNEYMALRQNTATVRQLSAFSYFPAMIGDDDPGGYPGIAVSCNFFLVEGLSRPVLGRLIDFSDCATPGQAPVAVISVKTWRTRLASDPHVIGRSVRLNNRPVTIVGVVPDATTNWLNPPAIWIPYTGQPYMDSSRNGFLDESLLWLSLAGRLAPGYSRTQARNEFTVLERQQDRLHNGRSTAVVTTDGTWIEEFELQMSGRDLMLMTFFLGSFFLVLLIACANVATLLLSRAATRRKEIAVRLSLGAPRIRLVRMLITECLILATLAGAASLYLVQRIPHPLFRYLAPRAPEFPMNPDWTIFLFLTVVVLLSGIFSGLAPALESVNVDLSSSIKGQTGSPAGNRVRGWLVTAQVAMSMVLLVGAALFGKAEDRTLHADPGYLPAQVVVAPIRFPESTPVSTARARLDAIAQRMRALPGVHSVAFSDTLPMVERHTIELRPPGRADAVQAVDVYTASPDYFNTLGLPILRGREFQESDMDAVVVSRGLARAFWPREDPLGKIVTMAGIPSTVVGVAKDVDASRFAASENLPLYHIRHAHPSHNMMSVRFEGDARAGATAVRAALREYDPTMFVTARTLQSWIDQITEVLWNVVSLILLLGIVATVLATTGIYGAVSFAVNQRTREMGIRLALGAQRLHIVREVFLSGGRPVLRGLFLGLWLSVAVAATLHHGMSGTPLHLDSSDPLIYTGAALLLAIAAALAMAGPARRGSKCNPLDALRCD